MFYRQGDVYVRVVKKPTTLKSETSDSKESRIIARGEFSDHAHVLVGEVTITKDADKHYVTVGPKGAILMHTMESKLPDDLKLFEKLQEADHKPIPLPALGKDEVYEIWIQNEYNPYSKHLQQSRD